MARDDDSAIDREKGYIRLNVDYGSWSLRVAMQYVRPGKTISETPIEDLMFSSRMKYQEQILGIDEQGLLAGRQKVQKWIETNKENAAGVIYLWKLCLSSDPRYRDSDESMQVYEAIGAKPGDLEAIREIIMDHLKLIRRQVLVSCRESFKTLHSVISDDMQMEASLTVPAAWDGHARGIMTEAATAAGFLNISLIHEPAAAAAAELINQRLLGYIEDGHPVVYGDAGHGTVDIATVQTRPSATEGRPFTLEVVGKPSGTMAGGRMVEDAAWLYVKTCPKVNEHGGIQALCMKLGISEQEFKRQLCDEIRTVKEGCIKERTTITVDGRSSPSTDGNDMSDFDIKIPKSIIEGFIIEWAKAICSAIICHLKSPGQIKGAVFVGTGGGFKNPMIVEYIRGELIRSGRVKHVYCSLEDNPVARGGLMQQPINEPDELSPGHWWIPRPQEWSVYEPEDASKWVRVRLYQDPQGILHSIPGDKRKRKRIQWKKVPDEERTYFFDDGGQPTRYVPDRLAQLMELRLDKSCRTWRVPMMFHLGVDGGQQQHALEFEIYFSPLDAKHRAPKEHGPLRDRKGRLNPHLEEWLIKIMDLPELTGRGYESTKGPDGQEQFELHGFVELHTSPGRLDFRVNVLAPGEQFQEAREGACEEVNMAWNYNFEIELSAELWETHRSHIVVRKPRSARLVQDSTHQQEPSLSQDLRTDHELHAPSRRSGRPRMKPTPRKAPRPELSASSMSVTNRLPVLRRPRSDYDQDDEEPEPSIKRPRLPSQ